MSILLIGNLNATDYQAWKRHLTAALPADEHLVLRDEAHDPADIDIALVANPAHGTLSAYPNLRFIQSLWAGVDRLLADPQLPRDVAIARLVDPNMTQAMVECVLNAVLFLHRQMPAYLRQQSMREWKQLPQPVAADRRVTLLGLGELGAAAARVLALLGFPVEGWSRHPKSIGGVRCVSGEEGLAEVLASADILVNLLPLTPDTAGLLGGATFARMKRGAAVVNLARGAHVSEPDLLAALDSGALDHVMLDVFTHEPLPQGHVFWSHPRITVLPHVAAHTEPATAARIAVENVTAFRNRQPVRALVDFQRGY